MKILIPFVICFSTLGGCAATSPEQQEANRLMALHMLMNMPPPPKAQFVPMPTAPRQPPQSAQSFAPNAVTAMWTGNQRQVQTVTNQSGWTCEYRYAGQTFWRTFIGTCPASIQVQ